MFKHQDLSIIIVYLFYRGVYLASLLYCDDRVLVTNEDMLPIVEVDDNFSGTSLNADFHWLMKVGSLHI